MSSCSERQSRVHAHDHRARLGNLLVMGADPQALPEPHGMKVAQPLALPNTVLDALARQAAGGDAERLGECPSNRRCIGFIGKQRAQAGCGPQPEFTRQWLQHRIVVRVDIRDRSCPELEAALFRRVRIPRAQLE